MTPQEHSQRAEQLLIKAEERLSNSHDDGANAVQYATTSMAHSAAAQAGYAAMAVQHVADLHGDEA